MQQEEIRKADIPNLEMCQYCNYAGKTRSYFYLLKIKLFFFKSNN
jgi:hypothetical protein